MTRIWRRILEKYNPADTIVFNLCETLPGIPYSEIRVLEIIEKQWIHLYRKYSGGNRAEL